MGWPKNGNKKASPVLMAVIAANTNVNGTARLFPSCHSLFSSPFGMGFVFSEYGSLSSFLSLALDKTLPHSIKGAMRDYRVYFGEIMRV